MTLTNSTKPSFPSLPDFDLVFVQSFLANMLVLYPLLGVHAFTGVPPAPAATSPHLSAPTHPTAAPADELLLRKGGEIIARGRCTATGGVVLLAGSLVAKKAADYAPEHLTRPRSQLQAAGALVEHDATWWRLAQDYECSASSTAAGISVGRPMRGPHEWKNASGTTLADLLQAAAAGVAGVSDQAVV